MCQLQEKSNVIIVAFQQMFKYYGLYKYFQTEICQCFTLKRPIYTLLLLLLLLLMMSLLKLLSFALVLHIFYRAK